MNQRPAALDESFLDRLTACAEGSFETLSSDEQKWEEQLAGAAPNDIPVSLGDKIMESIGDTPFTVDGKIVLFNKAKHEKSATTGKRSNIVKFNIAAAAAVALMGSMAALVYPGASTQQGPSVADREPIVESAPLMESAPSNFAPASYNRDLNSINDQGVVWQNGVQPYRVYDMISRDKVTLENADGETIQMEQPRMERILMPEQID